MKKNKKLVNKNYFNRIITWVKHKDNYPYIIFIIVGIIISSFEYGFFASFFGIIGSILVYSLIVIILYKF
tara:strand:+ start:596 stop:805 length:210 start_codon:yes stop_codon:yes gene_type:complete